VLGGRRIERGKKKKRASGGEKKGGPAESRFFFSFGWAPGLRPNGMRGEIKGGEGSPCLGHGVAERGRAVARGGGGGVGTGGGGDGWGLGFRADPAPAGPQKKKKWAQALKRLFKGFSAIGQFLGGGGISRGFLGGKIPGRGAEAADGEGWASAQLGG